MRTALILLLLVGVAFGQAYEVKNFGGPVINAIHPFTLGPNQFSYAENLLSAGTTRISRPGWSKAFSGYLGTDPIDGFGIIEADDSVWACALYGGIWKFTTIGAYNQSVIGGGYSWLASWNAWRELRPFTEGILSITSGNSVGATSGRNIRDLSPGDTLYQASDSTKIGVVKYIIDDDAFELTTTAGATFTNQPYFVRRTFASKRTDVTEAYDNLYTANAVDPLHELYAYDSAIFMRRLRIVDTVAVRYATSQFPPDATTYPYVDQYGWTSISDTTMHISATWNLDSNRNDGHAAHWRFIKIEDSTKAWADGEWAGLLGGQPTGANLYYFAFANRGNIVLGTFPRSYQNRYFPIYDNSATALLLQAPQWDSFATMLYIDSTEGPGQPPSWYPVEGYYWAHQARNIYTPTTGYIVSIAGAGEVVFSSGQVGDADTVQLAARAHWAMVKADTSDFATSGWEDNMWDAGIYYLHDPRPMRANAAITGQQCDYCRGANYNPWHFIRRTVIKNDSLFIITADFPDSTFNLDTTSVWEIVRFDVPHFNELELYQEELVGWGDTLAPREIMHTRTTVRGPEPDNWSTEGAFVASRTLENVTAALAYDDRFFYWTENTTNAIVGDIDDGTITEIAIDIGCTAPGSVIGNNKKVYFYWKGDFWETQRRDLSGYSVAPLTLQLAPVFNDLYGGRRHDNLVRHPVNPAYDYKIEGVYDPSIGRIWWFYPDTGSTVNSHAVTLDPVNGQFDGFHTFGAASAMSYKYKDTLRLMMANPEDGMVWITDGSFEDSGRTFIPRIGGVYLSPNSDSVVSKLRDVWMRFAHDNSISGNIGSIRFICELDEVLTDTLSTTYTSQNTANTRFVHYSAPLSSESLGGARVFRWDLEWAGDEANGNSFWEPISLTLLFRPERAGD